jgi:DNA replication protein DnaC
MEERMENTQSISTVIDQTLATLVSAREPLTTAKLSDEKKRRRWLDKWLRLNSQHSHQLKALENSVYQFCAEFSKHPKRGRRLVIYGNNGAGKSHTLRAIHRWANALSINLPLVMGKDGEYRLSDSMFLHWPATVNRLKEGEYWIIEEAMSVDVGAEHDPSKSGCEKLYLLLERREFMWTVITTNAIPEAWEEKFERRISSRLIRNSELINVENVPDYNSL